LLGIIFTGAQAPEARIIKQLLETEAKGALVIAADSGLAAAQDAGVKPDWAVGDFDSLDDESRLSEVAKERLIRYERDKDYTDTELAFSLAIEKGCGEIWIIGGGGGRIDHLFAIRSLFERELFPRRWITDSEDIFCVNSSGEEKIFSVCLKKNALVSVFPLGSGPWDAQSRGLKWPLSNLPWDRGFFGLSNEAEDGDVSITAKSGRFMVILPLNY